MLTEENEEWIRWEKSFELGIPAIDEQHRHLVGLCNQLHGEIMASRTTNENTWREAFSDALREAVNYTKTHFSLEEKLMAAAGFENLSLHKRRHHEFIEKIGELLSSFDQSNLQVALEFSRFLYDWITVHIAHEDKLYAKKVLDYLAAHKRAEQA